MHRRNMRRSRSENARNPVDFSRTYLKQVVAIHQAMFEKLLFDDDAAIGQDLAELFQDAGRTYLQIAERISEDCLHLQD
jgi:hypothetical protein